MYNARAKYSFTATHNDELSFAKGDVLEVTKELNGDWVEARQASGGRTGFAPANRLVRLEEEGEETPPPPPPRRNRGATHAAIVQPHVHGRTEFGGGMSRREGSTASRQRSQTGLAGPGEGVIRRGRASSTIPSADFMFKTPFKDKVKTRLNRFLAQRPTAGDLSAKNIFDGGSSTSSSSSSGSSSSSSGAAGTGGSSGSGGGNAGASGDGEDKESRTFKLPALNLRGFKTEDTSKSGRVKFLERFIRTRSDRMELEELNILQAFQPIFGETLQDIAKLSQEPVPTFVQNAVAFLDKHLETEGIFRIPADAGTVQRIRMELNQKNDLSLEEHDVHEVAALLKLFLRELREPLLSNALHDEFVALHGVASASSALIGLRSLVQRLPVENRAVLAVLVPFLARVAARSEVNKMDVPNLALIFGPNILRPSTESSFAFANIGAQVYVLQTMIENTESLFADGDVLPSNTIAAVALYDYEGEVQFSEGDEISVYVTHEGGWSEGMVQRSGAYGMFPTDYVRFVRSKGGGGKGGGGNGTAGAGEGGEGGEGVEQTVMALAEKIVKYEGQIKQAQGKVDKVKVSIESEREELDGARAKGKELEAEIERVSREFEEVYSETVATVMADNNDQDLVELRDEVENQSRRVEILRAERERLSRIAGTGGEVEREVNELRLRVFLLAKSVEVMEGLLEG